jgi:hypothetical protein
MARCGTGLYPRSMQLPAFAVAPGWRVSASLVLGTLLLSGSLHSQDCGADRLALAESSALSLPATFGIQGWAADRRGAVALWSVGGEVLAIDAERALARIRLPDTLTPAGLALSGDTLRFLDLAGGREYRLVAGRLMQTGRSAVLGPGLLLEQAVLLDDQWVIAVREAETGALLVYRLGSRVRYRVPPAVDPGALRRVQLSLADGTVLLTELMAPFRVVRLDPLTGHADTLAPVLRHAVASLIPADSLLFWRALPAVALDCAVLLTLSDLRSDRRLLARYDVAGRVVRVTPLEAPLGMVAALGDESLLAARRAGELELVWYSWRWVRDPAISP